MIVIEANGVHIENALINTIYSGLDDISLQPDTAIFAT
jgi:hypothetical protein